MPATAVEPAQAETPSLPDYVLDPNATLKDTSSNWRHGRAPDYSRTRQVYEQSMSIQSTAKTPHRFSISFTLFSKISLYFLADNSS
jgi:hypothetical protein